MLEANNQIKNVSSIVKNDFVTIKDDIYHELLNRNINKKGQILDVGCGWGRFFNFFEKLGLTIYGIDISINMIEKAKQFKSKNEIQIYQGEAENLQFKTNYFDYLTCFGVFEATFQDKALSEFLRVLKTDGLLFLTGRNIFYHDDDHEARLAEIGAREKGEPNYFTDVKSMLEQLKLNNHQIIESYFFKRRGDFPIWNYVKEFQPLFYEYLFVIRKGSEKNIFSPFSRDHSKNSLRFKHEK